MARRSKFAAAAEEWFRNEDLTSASASELWSGLSRSRPDITAASDSRKTPRATCMRDLRKDPQFDVAAGKISLRLPS
jgi:hypothetical protein